jgi:protein ImuB
MLWLALHFPLLPLEIFTRGGPRAGSFAVVSSPGNNAMVVACNPAAQRRGVCSGMPVSAAWALASDLEVIVRDAAAEYAALKRVAAWALQFTPKVNIASAADVLLEVAGSLKLFGGLHRLCTLAESGLAMLGYGAVVACAPTPSAAQLFARAGLAAKIQHRDALRYSLDPLPIDLLDQPQEVISTLHDIGIRTLGECLRLPRDGLVRRCGRKLLDDLDRALGSIPDPRASFVPPSNFAASLPLPAPVEQAEALLFAARRLLAELCGFLAATGNGVQHLRFVLSHDDHPATQLAIKLAAASRELEHLVSILRERLARLRLRCPVTAIAMTSELLLPLSSHNLSLLPHAGDNAEGIIKLIERLRARLGDGGVCGLTTVMDHRPEHAWRTCTAGDNGAPGEFSVRSSCPRPLWLLRAPQPLKEAASAPCYGGPLTLLAGPERIESGWWDEKDVARDYFIARNPQQSLLWIYRERHGGGRWYLHGLFA